MNIWIKSIAPGEYRWFAKEVSDTSDQGSLEQFKAFIAPLNEQHTTVCHLIIDALDCAARKIVFAHKERKHIQKALPFLLEESILTDIDNMHYVHNKPEQHFVDVQVLDKSFLEGQLAPFIKAGITIDHCYSEFNLLSKTCPDDAWQLVFVDNKFLIQTDSNETAAIEAEHLELALQSVSEGFSHLPREIILLADASELENAKALVPSSLQSILALQSFNYYEHFEQLANNKALQVWDFLTGSFAKVWQWQKMLWPWRFVFAMASTVFLALMLLWSLQLGQAKEQRAQLAKETETLARKVIPRGNIVDYQRQLKPFLKNAQSDGSDNGFMALFSRVAKVLHQQDIKSVMSLNFDSSSQAVRLDFLVKDYDQLQSIIGKLKQQKLQADIQNSNAQGEELRVRLKVVGQS